MKRRFSVFNVLNDNEIAYGLSRVKLKRLLEAEIFA